MASRFPGIAPAMQKPPLMSGPQTPPIMDPQAKPAVQPQPPAMTSAPAGVPGATPSAARDMALRNLGTQTAAAPTSAVPQGAQSLGAGPGGAAAGARVDAAMSNPHVTEWLTGHPDAQPYVDALHNAVTPQDRMSAIASLISLFHQDRNNHGQDRRAERADERQMRNNGGMMDDNSEYSAEHDRLQAQDDAAAAQGASPVMADDEAARLEAARIKRMRQSRIGG